MTDHNGEVRFSDFTIMGELPEDNNAFIAVHSLTESVALVGRDTVDAIEQGIHSDDPAHSEELDELARAGLIVPKEKNEMHSLRFTLMKSITHDIHSRHTFVVHPTMNCNLACPYCYAWRNKGETMSEEIATQLLDWIKEQIETRELKSTGLVFCGGEPLLEAPIILKLTREFSNYCRDKDVKASFSIITNGVLFSKDFVEQWLDCMDASDNMDAQVTLDGPEHVHNARRKAKDGTNSFQTIMANLHDLGSLDTDAKKRVSISIRMNLDSQNVDSIMELMEQLQPLVKNCDGLAVNAYTTNVFRTCLPHDDYVFSKDKWLETVVPYWYMIAEKYGIDVSIHRNVRPCMEFVADAGTCIGPDGYLYSCYGMVGNTSLALGHIDTGISTDAYHEHYGLMPWDECIGKCPIIAWCWGGCRGQVLVDSGDWKGIVCNKASLIREGLIFNRFKHRDRIAKWLYNRKHNLDADESDDYTVFQA